MLTPDQLRIRSRDNEIRKLRFENQRLENKLTEIREGVVVLLRGVGYKGNSGRDKIDVAMGVKS